MIRPLALAAAAPLALLAFTTPAAAQDLTDPSGERVNALIVYGNDPCPRAANDSVVSSLAGRGRLNQY